MIFIAYIQACRAVFLMVDALGESHEDEEARQHVLEGLERLAERHSMSRR